MIKNLSFAILFATILFGCGGGNVYIDNPTEDDITVSIDGGAGIEVLALSHLYTSIDEGSHDMVVTDQDGSQIHSGSFSMESGGILNATGQIYVVYKEAYALDNVEYEDYEHLMNDTFVMIDSFYYFGDIVMYHEDDLYIPDSWNYGLDTDLPEEVELQASEQYSIRSKVYRKDAFVDDNVDFRIGAGDDEEWEDEGDWEDEDEWEDE